MSVSLAFHVLGLVMCFGGLLVVSRVMAIAQNNSSSEFAIDYRALLKTYKIWTLGGLGILLASGLYQLISRGVNYYMSQGWFHGKLTLVLVLIIVVFYMLNLVKRVVDGYEVGKSKFMAVHGIVGLILILGTFLTFLFK